MKKIAIIFAGGAGQRMGAEIPKQFLKVQGKEILIHTLELFESNQNIDEIYVACIKDYIDFVNDLVKKYNCNVFIDDSVDNCEEVLSKIPDIKVILFETKYNYNCDSDIDHANDWKKLAKELIEYRETIYE